jgi:hypothetical protein
MRLLDIERLSQSLFSGSVLTALLCGILTSSANGEVIVVDDDFPTDGALVGTTPSPGPGGEWANHCGSGSFIMISSGEVVLTHGSGSREDANSSFSPLTSGMANYAFEFSVDDLTAPFSGADFEYFASFGATGANSTLLGRVELVTPSANRDF